MTIRKMPERQVVKVMETDEQYLAGGLVAERTEQLSTLRLLLYKHGVHAGTERARVRLYHDEALTSVYATSSWSSIDAIENLADYWRGWLGFTFEPMRWLVADTTYYVAVEVDDYTRDGDTFYLSFAYDWPIAASLQLSETGGVSLAMQPWAYRKVRY